MDDGPTPEPAGAEPAQAPDHGPQHAPERGQAPQGPQGQIAAAETRLRAALANLERAERRGAPAEELRLMEEAVIAARVTYVRAMMRARPGLTRLERSQLDRDMELLRRFPSDREGDGGIGWFDWPPRR